MAVPKSVITDAELDILKVLWELPLGTAREITESLYEEVNHSSMGTVQKLLARLEGKKLIERERNKTPHQFRALVTQVDVAGMQLDEFANKSLWSQPQLPMGDDCARKCNKRFESVCFSISSHADSSKLLEPRNCSFYWPPQSSKTVGSRLTALLNLRFNSAHFKSLN